MVSLLLPKFALCHSLFFYKSKPDTLKVIPANEGDGAWRSWYPAGSRPCARHCIGISRTRLVGRGIDCIRCRHSRPRSPPFRSAPAAAPLPPPQATGSCPAALPSLRGVCAPPHRPYIRAPRLALSSSALPHAAPAAASAPHGLFRPQPPRRRPSAPLGMLPSGRAL